MKKFIPIFLISLFVIISCTAQKQEFLNGMSIKSFGFFFFYAIYGMILNLLIEVSNSSKLKIKKFRLKIYLKHNWLRLITSIAILPPALIFSNELFPLLGYSNLSAINAFFIGGGVDKLSEMIKNKNSGIQEEDEDGNKVCKCCGQSLEIIDPSKI